MRPASLILFCSVAFLWLQTGIAQNQIEGRYNFLFSSPVPDKQDTLDSIPLVFHGDYIQEGDTNFSLHIMDSLMFIKSIRLMKISQLVVDTVEHIYIKNRELYGYNDMPTPYVKEDGYYYFPLIIKHTVADLHNDRLKYWNDFLVINTPEQEHLWSVFLIRKEEDTLTFFGFDYDPIDSLLWTLNPSIEAFENQYPMVSLKADSTLLERLFNEQSLLPERRYVRKEE